MQKTKNTYKKSGVNIKLADQFVNYIAKVSKKNVQKKTKYLNKDNIGAFGSTFDISKIKIKDDQSIIEACNELIEKNNFKYIVAKKGNKGMTIVGKDNFVKHISAQFVKNHDVTGAGDTVISVLSIVYAKTQDIELSAKLANAAAAIVVGKAGTDIVTVDELTKSSFL